MPHRPIRGKTGVHLLRSILVPAALLAGCGHQEAFPPGEVPNAGPRSTVPPIRLTLAPGEDLAPAWLNDDASLVYSFRRETRSGTDRCLGQLPPDGGTRVLEKCILSGPDADSVDALGPVAVGPANRAAWVDARSLAGRVAPDKGGIRVGSLAPADTGVLVRTLPYPAPNGVLHATATHLGWLKRDLLSYIGADVFYVTPCQGCKLDTVVISRDAVLLDLSASPAALQIIPNTSEVTSLFPSADGLSLYYTRAGDTRVYQQVLSTGTEAMIHDFGGSGIARDAQIRGNVLTAVVGGKVSYVNDALLGPRQIDSGGILYRVNLTDGSELPLAFAPGVVQHPALSGDGRNVVVEGVDTNGPPPRTDLWLYRLP
jgi:hypothetical protein